MGVLTDLAGLGAFGSAMQKRSQGGGGGGGGSQNPGKRRSSPYDPVPGSVDVTSDDWSDDSSLNNGRRKRSNGKRD